MSRTIRLFVAAAGTFGIAAALAFAAPPNGDFESGAFNGWKTFDSTGGVKKAFSTGKWQVYKGKLKIDDGPVPRGPAPEMAVLAEPPQGKYAAGLSTRDPGTHILHRVLEADGKGELSMQLAYENTADDFYVQDHLNAGEPLRGGGSVTPNQQLRIDLLKPNAPIDTLEKSDIIDTLLKTKPGDKRKRAYSKLEADVKDGKFRLRIAEVDNQAPFLVGVDAVKLKAK